MPIFNQLLLECTPTCIAGYCDYALTGNVSTPAMCKCPDFFMGDSCDLSNLSLSFFDFLIVLTLFFLKKIIECPDCSLNGNCVVYNGTAVCECLDDFFGPNCNLSIICYYYNYVIQ